MRSLYTIQALLHCASRHRSVVHSSILLLSKRAYLLDFFLVAIESIYYLILIQQIIWEYIINVYAIIINTSLIHCESCCWFVQF